MPLAQDYPSAAEIRQQEYTKKLTQADVDLIDRFQARVDEFALKYNALVQLREDVYASGVQDLITRYNKAIYEGNNISNLIESATLGINNMLASLKRQWGDDYIILDAEVTEELKGLGQMLHKRLIDIAGVGLVSIIAYIAGWLNRTDSLNNAYSIYRDIREKEPELSHELAWSRALQMAPPVQRGLMDQARGMFPLLIGAAIIWFLFFRR